jgi:hypothetical protein
MWGTKACSTNAGSREEKGIEMTERQSETKSKPRGLVFIWSFRNNGAAGLRLARTPMASICHPNPLGAQRYVERITKCLTEMGLARPKQAVSA